MAFYGLFKCCSSYPPFSICVSYLGLCFIMSPCMFCSQLNVCKRTKEFKLKILNEIVMKVKYFVSEARWKQVIKLCVLKMMFRLCPIWKYKQVRKYSHFHLDIYIKIKIYAHWEFEKSFQRWYNISYFFLMVSFYATHVWHPYILLLSRDEKDCQYTSLSLVGVFSPDSKGLFYHWLIIV